MAALNLPRRMPPASDRSERGNSHKVSLSIKLSLFPVFCFGRMSFSMLWNYFVSHLNLTCQFCSFIFFISSKVITFSLLLKLIIFFRVTEYDLLCVACCYFIYHHSYLRYFRQSLMTFQLWQLCCLRLLWLPVDIVSEFSTEHKLNGMTRPAFSHTPAGQSDGSFQESSKAFWS